MANNATFFNPCMRNYRQQVPQAPSNPSGWPNTPTYFAEGLLGNFGHFRRSTDSLEGSLALLRCQRLSNSKYLYFPAEVNVFLYQTCHYRPTIDLTPCFGSILPFALVVVRFDSFKWLIETTFDFSSFSTCN